MTLKTAPFRLIGVFLLGYIVYVTDLRAVFSQLGGIGMPSLAAAVGAFGVLVVARCWRWLTLVRCVGATMPAMEVFLSCNASIWFGLVTPGRVGEFTRGVDLARQSGMQLGDTSALVLFDLLLDLFAYAVLAAAGVLTLVSLDTSGGKLIYAACTLVGVLCLLFIRFPIAALVRCVPGLSRLPGLASLLNLLTSGLPFGSASRIVAATAIAAVTLTVMVYALVDSLHLPLGFTETLAMVGLVGVSGALPITYFGFGTREVTLIWYLGRQELPVEAAVAVSFMFVLTQLIGVATSIVLGFAVGRAAGRRQR